MTNGLKNLFDTFIREKQFLANLSPRTLASYKEIFARYEKYVNASDLPTQETLDQFIIGMREAGLSVTTVNISLRSFNSFLSWLTEHNKIPALRLKKLKEEKRVMKTLSDKQLSALYNWKPQSRAEHRLYTLLCLLIDTRVRINEALTLKNQNVDFDNLLVTVMGKGGKERIIPISAELRKIMYRYSTKYKYSRFPTEVFFSTSTGTKLGYHNTYRDLKRVLKT